MRILKTIFVIFLTLILILFIGFIVFIKTFDINKYLNQITQTLSQSLHREVKVGHGNLDFSLFKGLTLVLDNVSISNDPPTSNPILTIQQASAKLNPIAIMTNQIQTSEISLKSSIISLDSPIKIQVPIDHMKAIVNNFSLKNPFDFNLKVKVLSTSQFNIELQSHCALDMGQSTFHMTDINVSSDLSQLDMARVKTITPLLKDVPVWPSQIKGKLLVQIPQLQASEKGLNENILITIKLNDGYVGFRELLNPIDRITLLAETNLKNLSVKQLDGHIGSNGQIEATGDIQGLTALPKYTFKIEGKTILIQDLIDQKTLPVELKGAINATFAGSGESFDPQAMLTNLKGQGDFNLIDGKIEKLNLLKVILEKLNFIPGLSGQIEAVLSTDLKNQIGSDTTLLDKVQAKFAIQDKVVSISNGRVESQIFLILLQGNVNFDFLVNMDVTTYLSREFSQALIKSVKPLSGLKDEQGRIYIPGQVSGKIPSVAYKPQIDDMAKKVAISEGVNQLEKVLDKNPEVKSILNAVLGGDSKEEASSTSEPQSGNAETSGESQEDSSKKMINGFLNKILKTKDQ